ncbi:MAG: RNase adapter protein RapZ [Actinomycetota bacterium]|jgi:UPF0042 nucleotide-binding protein|nr:RNase adapter RapZ [Cryptosporangiaceae bacterium]MDQ1678158.1 RNase adapter protein RapZ [Actinomycetota bacterium]
MTEPAAVATGLPDAGPDEMGPDEMDLVIVTGLSGAGRSTVARALENVGYYVVDNLPQSLVLRMAELAQQSGGAARRTAIVLDVRSRVISGDIDAAIAELRARGFHPRILFVDADDAVLVRRYESVRRKHPLQGDGRLADGIAAERRLLLDARGEADLVLDTTDLNVNQLRNRVEEVFGTVEHQLRATVLSFGFKYGVPGDADFVVDMRFLPNPHWVPGLRPRTGQDPEVAGYVLGQPGAEDFLQRYAALLTEVVTGFRHEGKQYLTVAVGCTGGKHRSVASAERLAGLLAASGLPTRVAHRDLGRE